MNIAVSHTGLTKKMIIKHQLLLFLALFLVERASAVVYYNQGVQIEKTHEENPYDETEEINSFLLQKENVLSTRDKSDHGEQMHPAFEDYQEQTMSFESDNEDNISNDSMNHLRHGVASKTENKITIGEPVYFDNVHSKRRIYAQSGKSSCEGVGAASGKSYDDQRWILILTTHNGQAAYYLSNNASGRRLYYKNGKVCAFSGGFYDDQKWRLESERKNGRIAYRIVHAMTGGRLFAKSGNNFKDGFGIYSGKKWDDQLWYEEY